MKPVQPYASKRHAEKVLNDLRAWNGSHAWTLGISRVMTDRDIIRTARDNERIRRAALTLGIDVVSGR